jgi:hypothetical protein
MKAAQQKPEIRATHIGKKPTAETKAKMSVAMSKWKPTIEHRAKRDAGWKRYQEVRRENENSS